ncbi:MAG: group II intron reverse transcriptase/maturase [Desulfomonilaceae bacterium]
MQTSLRGIANRAATHKKHRFRNLSGLLNEANLAWCFRFLRKDAAPGADGVDVLEYQQDLESNIHDLVERLKGQRYRAKLVRRRYIPKPNGKMRPLGIPATEDMLLQIAVAKILEAIYEQDFLDFSHGYRPGRSPQAASKDLGRTLLAGKYCWVVEADIRGFFDTIDHEWMMKMLEERIDDTPFLRLIRKWLRAGILETDGQVVHPVTGTPQGGIVSPVLANIYLHYVLDLWFERRIKPRCHGEAMIIRFADDFVCAFQSRSDAESFYKELGERLGKFGLELAPDKTRILRFCRFDLKGSGRFDFLGFEYYWERTRTGRLGVKRRTSRKKLRASLANLTDWIRRNRSLRVGRLLPVLRGKYRGYWNYYGVIGNSASLSQFFYRSKRILFKWLNRRSQRRSYTWTGFQDLLDFFGVEGPKITAQHIPTQLRFL